MNASRQLDQTYSDIKTKAGFLPAGYKNFSKSALPGAWKEMKDFELNPDTEIPIKYKELINLAVASQIPSSYCVYAHTAYAKADGASNEEISDAVTIASIVRRFSTFINGIGMDFDTFKDDVDQVVTYQKGLRVLGTKPSSEVTSIETSAQAYKDMDHTLGLVPKFFLAYPETGVAGAWREFKEFQLSQDTAIPNKYKELIGLGIAAQIPCQYCRYFHVEVAKLFGATASEMNEAIAVAANARHWSAAFNGFQGDLQEFEQEFDESLSHVRQVQ